MKTTSSQAFFPLPLWEKVAFAEANAGGGAFSTDRPPHPNPLPHGRGGALPVVCRDPITLERSHHDRDVFHTGHLELADLRRRADGAGIARAGRLPVLARARRPAGRAVVVCVQSVLAAAAPDVRGLRRRCGAAVAAGRAQQQAVSKSNPFLNKRAEALVGRVFTLEKPIIDGAGTVRIDDTIWRVAGPDAPAGSRVRSCRPTAPA